MTVLDHFEIENDESLRLQVVHGLSSLFTDLIDFDDALNLQAAQQYTQNREQFVSRAREYIAR